MGTITEITDPNVIKNIQNQTKPTFADKIKSGFNMAKSFVTGEGRTEFENLPELSMATGEFTPGQSFKTGVGFTLTPDINARMQIIQSQVPDAQFSTDSYNNPIVRLPSGNVYYINKPGFSFQDLSDILSEGLKFAGGGKIAERIFPKGNFIKNVAVQTGGAGATSIAGDVAAKGFGAEDNVDLTRAGLVSGLTGFFTAASPLVSAMIPKRKLIGADGKLTKKGKKILQQAGYDPDTISPAQAKLFAAYMSQGSTARQSAAAVEDGAFGIPYYKAQLSGDKELLGILESARRGVFGKDVQKIIIDADAKQQYAMVDALRTIQKELRINKTDSMSGKPYGAILKDEEAGEILVESLKRLDDEFTSKIKTAYNNVDDSGAFLGDSLTAIKTNTNKRIRSESVLDADLTPVYNQASQKINKFIIDFTKSKKEGILDFATIQKFDTQRKILNDFIKKAEPGSLDKKNLTILKQEYDKFLDDAYDQMLFSGDELALESLKEARSIVRTHKDMLRVNDKFDKGVIVKDEAGRIVNKIIAEDVSPLEALNYIFGVSAIGSKNTARKTIEKLVGKDGIYARDSVEFDALRQAAFNKIVKDATKRDGFSVQTFLKNMDNALDGKGKEIMEVLFSKDEIALFRNYSNAVAKTLTPKEVLNPSGTASALGRLFQGTMEALAKIVGFNAAGMQGLIAAKILSARGRKYMTEKKMSQILEGVGDPPPGIQTINNRGLIPGLLVPQYEGLKNTESLEKRGLLQ